MVCSSTGQNLSTSTYIGEVTFTIFVAILGLFLFALLIGNMQVSPWDDLSKPSIFFSYVGNSIVGEEGFESWTSSLEKLGSANRVYYSLPLKFYLNYKQT